LIDAGRPTLPPDDALFLERQTLTAKEQQAIPTR